MVIKRNGSKSSAGRFGGKKHQGQRLIGRETGLGKKGSLTRG